jgi:hypothetical protein
MEGFCEHGNDIYFRTKKVVNFLNTRGTVNCRRAVSTGLLHRGGLCYEEVSVERMCFMAQYLHLFVVSNLVQAMTYNRYTHLSDPG